MKKTNISMLALAAGIMILAGCEKDQIVPVTAEGVQTLTATFPSNPTKTAIDEDNALQVNWSAGDSIIVYSSEKESAKFTLTWGAGTTKGAFTGSIADTPKGAFYPYDTQNVYGDATASLGHVPNLQIVPEGGFDPKAALMVGLVNDNVINFNWAVTFIKVTAPAEVENLAAIVLSGPIFTGNMSINTSTGQYFMVSKTTYGVTIKPKDGVFVAGSDYYAAAICSRNAPLKVTYVYVDNDTHKAVTKAKTSNENFKVANGLVTSVPAIDMTGAEIHTATQLEKDGPFYADFNLGATITSWGDLSTSTNDDTSIPGYEALYCTENVGGLYAWNCTNPSFPNARVDGAWGESGLTINTSRDTATELWGGAWRQPTYAEVSHFMDGTKFLWTAISGLSSSQYCDGCTIAGVKLSCKSEDAYTENSIFLPDAGYYDNSKQKFVSQHVIGFYWTCDPYNSSGDQAYCFNDTWDGVMAPANSILGHSVRPVLALDGNLCR